MYIGYSITSYNQAFAVGETSSTSESINILSNVSYQLLNNLFIFLHLQDTIEFSIYEILNAFDNILDEGDTIVVQIEAHVADQQTHTTEEVLSASGLVIHC